MKSISTIEVRQVLRATRCVRDHLMFLLAFNHGMRASEVCDLKIADLDFRSDPPTITVRRVKGSKKTTQPLSLEERAAIEVWMKERNKLLKDRGYDSEFLFISKKNPKVSRSQFFKLFKEAAESAGLPPDKRHPHVLKHALGRAMVEARVPIPIIQKALGHKSIGATSVYVEASDEDANRELLKVIEP